MRADGGRSQRTVLKHRIHSTGCRVMMLLSSLSDVVGLRRSSSMLQLLHAISFFSFTGALWEYLQTE